MARLLLGVVLLLAGCAEHVKPVASSIPNPDAQAALLHAPPKKSASALKAEKAEHDVLLAQKAFLSDAPDSAERAVSLYKAAAAQGSALAQYNLGVLYEEGRGVPSDPAQAALWYKRAVANHDAAVRSLASRRLTNLMPPPQQAADE